jgi:hypothetical protein
LKLDLTQVIVDFSRFKRSAIRPDFFYGKENNKFYNPPIFKSQERNLPKNYTTPKELKTYLGSVKLELLDPRNINNVKHNLPVEEI